MNKNSTMPNYVMNVLDIPSQKHKVSMRMFLLSFLVNVARSLVKQWRSNKLREFSRLRESKHVSEKKIARENFPLKFFLIMTEMENYFHICFKLFHRSTSAVRVAQFLREENKSRLWATNVLTTEMRKKNCCRVFFLSFSLLELLRKKKKYKRKSRQQ
jgi:hypothetical protein